MSRWYRAYEGTTTDAKLAEVASLAGVSRSVVIATWHALLESCAGTQDAGRFTITARRIAAALVEPAEAVAKVFDGLTEVGMIQGDRVLAWSRRQFESDNSTGRSRKHRQNKANVAKEEGNGDATLQGRCETSPYESVSVPHEEQEPSKVAALPRAREAKQTYREALEAVLTRDMASAIIEHRKKKRAPLTLLAAQELAKAFDATGDPEAAARMMIARGWQGFEADWFLKDRDGGKQTHNQGRNGRQRGGIVDLAAGFLGVSPEWPDDRHGGSDDLRGSSADADAEGWPRGPTHAITGRA